MGREEMREKLKEKAKEKLDAKLKNVSLLQRKRFWLSVAIIGVAYFGFSPAPINSGAPVTVGLLQTITRTLITAGFKLAYEFKVARALPSLRSVVSNPSAIVDGVDHETIERSDYALHVFKPEGIATNAPAIILIHGGGWVVGDIPTNNKLSSTMARELGAVVFAPDYRLAPEHLYPAALDDCVDAINFVYTEAETYGVDPANIIVTGDSAGGQLTITSAMAVDEQFAIPLKAILPVYPVTQAVSIGTPSYVENEQHLLTRYHMAAFWSSYLHGDGDRIHSLMSNSVIKAVLNKYPAVGDIVPLLAEGMELDDSVDEDLIDAHYLEYGVSPLFADEDLLEFLPPTKIYVAEHDVLRNDGEMFYERLKSIGHDHVEIEVWEGAVHGQQIFSEQAAPMELDPNATKQISGYFADIKAMIDMEVQVEDAEEEETHHIEHPDEAIFDDNE